jgi:ornithine--oxo-acid transaminase
MSTDTRTQSSASVPQQDSSLSGHVPFDLAALLDEHKGQSIDLIDKHVNSAMMKVLKVLGFDVNYVRGEGAYLYDEKGQRYIDCVGGFGVFACGRNHPVIRDALKQGMDLNLPNLPKFGAPRVAGLLARELLKIAPSHFDRVYFPNSGTEGIETSMKYARAATGRERILYCEKGYHGLTMGALSINGGEEFRKGFGVLLENVTRIPFNNIEALENELKKGDVAGFVVEPIQGKGVFVPDDDYLPCVAELCTKHGSLFIADEVQTGYGRTGKMFACEHWDVEPDIMVTSKALSGGYIPTGAVFSREWIHKKVFSGMDRCVVHSTTFTQNDMSAVAGLATLHVLRNENIVERTAEIGQLLIDKMQPLVQKYEMLKDVRGKGLLIGIEFGAPKSLKLKVGWNLIQAIDKGMFPQAVLIPLLQQHHILAQVAGHNQNVIKLLPPLVLNEQDVDDIVAGLDATIGACHKIGGPVWKIAKQLGQYAVGIRG